MDYRTADIDPTDLAILDYAVKLTEEPWLMNEADAVALKNVGLDDLAIHDLATVVAYFAFVNRVADGLGVDLEGRFD